MEYAFNRVITEVWEFFVAYKTHAKVPQKIVGNSLADFNFSGFFLPKFELEPPMVIYQLT